ncbi:MAG: hypothetical protein ISQ08_00230 [Planctomycetes bacterium]|nr:hypothetical protein [Planctomycetota bacterium]MDA0948353.1 hypothetical protein [Planctomycetota bacterium]
MDFENYWQENKNFVLSVAGGALVFLIAFLVLDSSYGADLRGSAARLGREQAKLRQSYYTNADLGRVEEEHEALVAARERLAAAAVFQPREGFRLRDGGGSPSNQYFGRVDRVQRELELLAGRARCVLPEGLGLEPLKTNDVEVIARQLEALDLLDRALRRAIEAGVDRITRVEVQLDPSLGGRAGLGRVERTRVQLRMTADPPAITRFLHATQRGDGALLVDSYDARAAAGREDEVALDITLVAVRLHELAEEDEE